MYPAAEQITDGFWHAALTGGIADASWTKLVFQNGILRSDIGVVVAEPSTAFYSAQFTPDSEGLWIVSCHETGAPTAKYVLKFQVYSLVTKLGGVDFDSNRHSLKQIRSVIENIRTQVSISSPIQMMPLKR